MKYIIIPLLVLLLACSQLKYSRSTEEKLPSLATVGSFEDYLLENIDHSKTTPSLSAPIRVRAEKIEIDKRAIFKKSDSLAMPLDSSLVSLTVIDEYSLISQLNDNKDLFHYIGSNDDFKIVTHVEMAFPKQIEDLILQGDEIFLIEDMPGVLRLKVRNGKKTKEVRFSDGKITNYSASKFCWGTPKGYKVKIVNLIGADEACEGNTYHSYRGAKRKSEFKFR